MKKDELAIPWTQNDKIILNMIKKDKDALLLTMAGKPANDARQWVDHGMIQTYEQESLDQLVGLNAQKNIYLDNAFAVIDELDRRGNIKNVPYVAALYLAAALSMKMQMPEKLTWVLNMAVAYGVGVDPNLDFADLEIANWRKTDDQFIQKLIEQPYLPPKWTKNPLTIKFYPIGNMYYYRTATLFQDVMELMKLNTAEFDFDKIQNKHSFELIHMTYELAKFYPSN